MRYFILFTSILFLTGCVTQEQADLKMTKGCAAGVNSLLQVNGKEIGEIKSSNYSDEEVDNSRHRRVKLDVIEKDGWLELDKSYSCLFMQDWGLLKSSHRALLVQVNMDDTIYGKKDGVLLGSFDDFINLTKTVDGAMAQ